MKRFAILVLFVSQLAVGYSALAALAGGTGLGGGFAGGKLLTERHCYVLQADALAARAGAVQKLAAADADTFIIDAYFTGSDDAGQFTSDELNQIRAGGSTSNRAMLAYLSIGEAEDYRPYWSAAWDADHNGKPDPGAPDWLLQQDAQFRGNYRVKYWNKAWQALIFGSPSASLDRILAQNFDGVYLDIVDGFETFEKGTDNALNPETGQTYRQDMIDFVTAIAAYARALKPNFLVVPQNGSQLLENNAYLQMISGIGQEDLYFNGNKTQRKPETAATVALLKKVSALGKAVLVTEYPTSKSKRQQAFKKALSDGFSIYVGPRALNKIGFGP